MVSGQYVQKFAEASHALPEGMHMNADYPFMLPKIVKIEGDQVTLEGRGQARITRKIERAPDGREYCDVEQRSAFEVMTKRKATKFRCWPFKDDYTEVAC